MAADGNGFPPWLAEEYYQRWLRDGLIDSAFPWERATSTTLRAFLDRYNFHDSILLGLWTPPVRQATLVIRWELAWNDGVDVPFDEEEIRDEELGAKYAAPFWPVILIRFSNLHQVTLLGVGYGSGTPFIFDVISHPLEDEGLARLLRARQRIHKIQGQGRKVGVPPPPPEPPTVGPLQETLVKVGRNHGFSLVHDPPVSILFMERSGEVRTIPDL